MDRVSRMQRKSKTLVIARKAGPDVYGLSLLAAGLLLAAAVAYVLAGLPALIMGPGPRVISGYASVVDGETIDLMGERIRLAGIDAPALGQDCLRRGTRQDCGREAALALRRLVGWQRIACVERGQDGIGRTLATCSYGQHDVAGSLISLGHAVEEASISRIVADSMGLAPALSLTVSR